MSTTINDLNDDCLESLFSLFTLLEWITVIRCVCTRWNVLIDRMHQSAFAPLDNSSEGDVDEFEIQDIVRFQDFDIRGFRDYEYSTREPVSIKRKVYLFKRIHFLVSFDFKPKVQANGSFLSGLLQSFWNIEKEDNPLVRDVDVDDEVFNTMVKNKLESVDLLKRRTFTELKKYKSKLVSIHCSLYHESNPKAVQRLNSFNALLSVAIFGNTLLYEHKCPKTISRIVHCILSLSPVPNCQCKQIDSPESSPFESLKLYREFGLFSDLTHTKANLMGHQIIELAHRMRPEKLSEKFENYHNLSIQTCNQMYKLELSLCMPSSSVAAEALRNCPHLHTLNLKFQNLDAFKFDQKVWKALLGLSQLNELGIAFASIDLSILEKVSLVSHVRTLTLERVEIVIQPADKVEGQRDAELVAQTLLRIFPDVQHVSMVFTDHHLTVLTGYYIRQLKPDIEIE